MMKHENVNIISPLANKENTPAEPPIEVPFYRECLSETSFDYFFHLDAYYLSGCISKNSPEGIQLSQLIATYSHSANVHSLIVRWCLKYMTNQDFLRIVDYVRKDTFDDAYKKGGDDVRRTLSEMLKIKD